VYICKLSLSGVVVVVGVDKNIQERVFVNSQIVFHETQQPLKKQNELKMKHTDRNVHHETDFIGVSAKH
jgi:hypothetical protein